MNWWPGQSSGGYTTGTSSFRYTPTKKVEPSTPKVFEGSPLDDLSLSFGDLYGTTIPVTYGVRRLFGKPIWWTDMIAEPDGEGGFRYFVNIALSLGVRGLDTGSLPKVRKIWADAELIYDRSSGHTITMPGLRFRFHAGTAGQPADPLIVKHEGAENTPAFRHLMTMVLERFPVERFDNRFPLISVEILDQASSTASITTVSYLAGPAEDTRAAVDWDTGLWYAIDNNTASLWTFSLDSNAQVASVPITWSPGVHGALESPFVYVPWRHLLFGVQNEPGVGSSTDRRFYAMDPVTGIVVATSDVIGASLDSTLFERMVAQKVTGANGLPETWLLAIDGFIDRLVAATFDPVLGFVIRVNTGPNLDLGISDVRAIAAGPVLDGMSVVYVGADDKVYELALLPGGDGALTLAYTSTANVSFLHYDPDDLGLVIGHTDDTSRKVSVTDWSTVLWTSTWGVSTRPTYGERISTHIGFIQTNTLRKIDLATGAWQSYSPGTIGTISIVGPWDDYSDSLLLTDRSAAALRVHGSTLTAGRTPLRTILEAIMAEADYPSSDYDFNAVTDEVDGMVRQEETTANAILADVAKAFGYYYVETDKIYMRRTPVDASFATVATIAESELIDRPDGTAWTALAISRQDDVRLPQKVEFGYMEAQVDYKWSNQMVRRMLYPVVTTAGRDTEHVRVPIIMTATEVQTKAYQLLYRLWQARTQPEFTLTLGRIDLEPGDAIAATAGGTTRMLRIAEAVFEPASWSYSLTTEVVLQREAITTTGDGGSLLVVSEVRIGASLFYPLDLPLLRPGHDLGGTALLMQFTMAAKSLGTWEGAVGYAGDVTGLSWSRIGSQTEQGTVGLLTTVLAAPDDPYRTDYDNSFTMRLRSGSASDLVSVTQLEMLNGANLFAVGQPGRLEVVAVRDWTANADGSYTASGGLLRGLYGTEVHTGDHAAGDLCVMLSNVRRTAFPLSAFGATLLFKAVGRGTAFDGAIATTAEITAAAEMPYAPAQLAAAIDGADIVLDWERRTRLDGEWEDLTEDVPLGEASEEYEIDIMDGATVVRSYTGIGASTKTYPAADITTDWGSMPASLTWRAYQVSQTLKSVDGTGRGHRAQTTSSL